jgi:uncharacterized protein YsxB (DUF464 family)
MTKFKFFKNDNNFVGFECSGHTGYGEFGEDVLCATISGITQSVVLGLTKVLDLKIGLKRNDKKGHLKVELPNDINFDKMQSAQVLIGTLYESIKDLIIGYSSYISMEVIENVY